MCSLKYTRQKHLAPCLTRDKTSSHLPYTKQNHKAPALYEKKTASICPSRKQHLRAVHDELEEGGEPVCGGPRVPGHEPLGQPDARGHARVRGQHPAVARRARVQAILVVAHRQLLHPRLVRLRNLQHSTPCLSRGLVKGGRDSLTYN